MRTRGGKWATSILQVLFLGPEIGHQIIFNYRMGEMIYFVLYLFYDIYLYARLQPLYNNNNNKRPLTPKSMPPAGDEHAKLKT